MYRLSKVLRFTDLDTQTPHVSARQRTRRMCASNATTCSEPNRLLRILTDDEPLCHRADESQPGYSPEVKTAPAGTASPWLSPPSPAAIAKLPRRPRTQRLCTWYAAASAMPMRSQSESHQTRARARPNHSQTHLPTFLNLALQPLLGDGESTSTRIVCAFLLDSLAPFSTTHIGQSIG